MKFYRIIFENLKNMIYRKSAGLEVKMSLENAAEWSKEKFDRELEYGYADMLAGRIKSAALVLLELKEKYKV